MDNRHQRSNNKDMVGNDKSSERQSTRASGHGCLGIKAVTFRYIRTCHYVLDPKTSGHNQSGNEDVRLEDQNAYAKPHFGGMEYFSHRLTTASMPYFFKLGAIAHSSCFNHLQFCSILNARLEVQVQVSWQSIPRYYVYPQHTKIGFFRTSDIYQYYSCTDVKTVVKKLDGANPRVCTLRNLRDREIDGPHAV